jgi:hypothetical protein
MPYVQGAGVHGVIHVADVYHSPNVYTNNVATALWQEAGESASFAGITPAAAPIYDPADVAVAAAETAAAVVTTTAYVSNPDAYYNPAAAVDGVKANYAGTPEDSTTATGIVSTASAAGIIPFLTSTLDEASRGMWRETGQGGKASNPNITKIWTQLGFTGSPWNTDQTAWCMGFVNFALKCSGFKFVQTASAKAIKQTPARWGATQVTTATAQPGDIVLWKYSHVNFIYTLSNGKATFVGGNQTPTSGKNNNPSDGDVTISYAGGSPLTNPNIDSIWRVA